MTFLPYQTIATQPAFDLFIEKLQDAPEIAIDTESDSLHHYHEKVCLIQITALNQDSIIDPLAIKNLDALGYVLENRNHTKVFHDAGYDLLCLHRDFGFVCHGLFDTMIASRLLGYTKFGLASLLLERFQFEANKKYQKSDWSKRPLSHEQLEYARYDTHFLPILRQQLTQELTEQNRLAWAQEDFERASRIIERHVLKRNHPSPDGFWRMKGLRTLTPIQRGRAKALHFARDKIAYHLDKPAFKICSDAAILDLSVHPPQPHESLQPRSGLGWLTIDRYGHVLLEALMHAKPVYHLKPKQPISDMPEEDFSSSAIKRRYESLREQRKHEATRLGLEPEVLASNAVLKELASYDMDTLEHLAKHEELSGWRLQTVGQALYAILKGSSRV